MLRLWSCALLLGSAPLLAAGDQQIQGTIVDASGASIAGASIRLLNSDSRELAHTISDDFGKFQMGIVRPDTYVLKAGQHGFRNRRVHVVVNSETQTIDLGNIRLDFVGRDAPDVNCDSFADPGPPDPVVSHGYLQLQTDCMLAFRLGKVFCPGGPKRTPQSHADVRLTTEGTGVYLNAMNGASFAAPELPPGNCPTGPSKETMVRIDGLGPGDDLCMYIHDRLWAHVFLTDNVRRDARQIELWQITRER